MMTEEEMFMDIGRRLNALESRLSKPTTKEEFMLQYVLSRSLACKERLGSSAAVEAESAWNQINPK